MCLSECTFLTYIHLHTGIMKGRFRILKLPFEFQDETYIDNVFYTCAVLHNKIQRHQNFDEVWKENEHWLGRGGLFGNEHVGSRLYGPPRGKNSTYIDVDAHSDFSGRGSVDMVSLDEGDMCESEAWKELGEDLARNYYSLKLNNKLKWPKGQRECAALLRSQT